MRNTHKRTFGDLAGDAAVIVFRVAKYVAPILWTAASVKYLVLG